MKKIFTLALAIVMIAVSSVVVFAADPTVETIEVDFTTDAVGTDYTIGTGFHDPLQDKSGVMQYGMKPKDNSSDPAVIAETYIAKEITVGENCTGIEVVVHYTTNGDTNRYCEVMIDDADAKRLGGEKGAESTSWTDIIDESATYGAVAAGAHTVKIIAASDFNGSTVKGVNVTGFTIKLTYTAAAVTPSVDPNPAVPEHVVCGGWWTEWSKAYEITDTPLVLNIAHTSQGTDNYDGLVAVFSNVYTDGASAPNEAGAAAGYAEYAVYRTDAYGWGTYYASPSWPVIKDADGQVVPNGLATDTTAADEAVQGAFWAAFRAIMADADIVATFTKTANGIALHYDVTGANGGTFTYDAAVTCDTSAGLYVFFTGEECTYDITLPAVETPPQTSAPQTGVAAAILSVVAVLSGAYIVSKKH